MFFERWQRSVMRYNESRAGKASKALREAAKKAGFAQVLSEWQVEVRQGSQGELYIEWDEEVAERYDGAERAAMVAERNAVVARAEAWLMKYIARMP
jgi:hypothetical protein